MTTTRNPAPAVRGSGKVSNRAKIVHFAAATATREDGVRFQGEEGAFNTFKAARRALDRIGTTGQVSVWEAGSPMRRRHIASRDANGRWTTTDAFTGETVEI